LDNEKGSADGKMRILDSLRKELLKLDEVEKSAEWPKVREELKKVFFDLEELIDKIKNNSADEDLNMEMVRAHIQEFRGKIEQIISEKNIRQAKALIQEIGQIDFDLRNAVTGNALDVQFLQQINNEFNTYHWKNPTKAKQLLNQGLQMAAEGNTSNIRPIIIQLINLLPDDEKPEVLE
jgi:molecular chaperone DnaK